MGSDPTTGLLDPRCRLMHLQIIGIHGVHLAVAITGPARQASHIDPGM
jgi:hypothetical protein